MVKDIKLHTKADLPRALIIVDDFLPLSHEATAEQAAVLLREQRLLARLRSLVPQAEVVLPGGGRNLADYAMVFSLNTVKDPAEEAALALCTSVVVYANPRPGQETDMTHRFTSSASQPLPRPDLGPENEYVVIVRPVDIDLDRFPTLQYRCRNTSNALVHIRYQGQTADGREVEAWLEGGDTDDRQSGGKWLEGQANVASIARQAAGEPIKRLTRIEVILDDLDTTGQSSLDIDYLRFVGADGNVGWEDPFDTIDDWSTHASFEGAPGGKERFDFSARQEDEASVGRIDMRSVVSSLMPGPLDQTTRMIEPLASVRVLVETELEGTTVPVLLLRDRACWMNTYTPDDACWETLFQTLLDHKLTKGVTFGSFSHSVTLEGLTSATNMAAATISQEALPVDRIRLVAPPELDQPLVHTLPAGYERMKLRVIKGQRGEIPFPDAGSQPPGITLLPGEVVEFVLLKPQSN